MIFEQNNKVFTHQDTGLLNRNLVLEYIRINKAVTRTDIWEHLDIARPTVTQIIKQLMQDNLVVETVSGDSRGGRRPVFLKFNAGVKSIILFYWHRSEIYLTDLNAEILQYCSIETDKKFPPEKFIPVIEKEIKTFITRNKIKKELILGVGMIIPGMIDSVNGKVVYCSNNQWANVFLADKLQDKLGLDIFVESDMFANSFGEYYYGAGKIHDRFVSMEALREGMGMVNINNQGIQKGANYMSGEVGHITLESGGLPCECGKRGCLEAYYKQALEDDNIEKVIEYLAHAAAIIINLLDPAVFLCSGSVFEGFFDDAFQSFKDDIYAKLLYADRRKLAIVRSALGKSAAILGMCEIVLKSNMQKLYTLRG